jgi:cytoskeleton protein RodZ
VKEIGVYLRKEREARKIRLEDVQEITKIRLRYLQAIEEGDLEVIPGEVYRKGFIASYANAIGLDGQEVVEKYNNLKLEQENQARLELEKLSNKRKSQPEPQKSVPSDNSHENENPKKKIKPKNKNAKKSKKTNRNLSKLVIALTVIIILLGLMLVLPKLNGGNQVTDNLERETTIPENRVVANDNAENTDNINTTETDANLRPENEAEADQDDVTTDQIYPAPVTVFAEFTEQVWVQVKSDGKSIFFNNGAVFDSKTPRQVWTAKEQLEIRIGNPAGIKLYFNGKEISQIGERGIPKTVKFNTEGLVMTP